MLAKLPVFTVYVVAEEVFVGDAVGLGDAEVCVGVGVADWLGLLSALLLQPVRASTPAAPNTTVDTKALRAEATTSPLIYYAVG